VAFPDDPQLPVMVEIAPGADPGDSPGTWSWVDITGYVRERDKIRITVGKQDEASRAAPSRCLLRLDNAAGDFSPRNPLGQWYGQLGPNTPLRVRARHAYDLFARTESNGWGTATSGQVWSVDAASAADYSVTSGRGRMSIASVNAERRIVINSGVTNQAMVVRSLLTVTPTGAPINWGVVLRHSSTSNYYWVDAQVGTDSSITLRLVKRVAGTLTQVTTAASGVVHSTSVSRWMRARIVGSRVQARVWADGDPEPQTWQLDVTDTSLPSGTGVGAVGRAMTGNTNGTFTLSFDQLDVSTDRFCGHVSSWPPRWDKSLVDATVPIQADGPLRQPRRSGSSARSALRRTIPASNPLAYWPAEDGADASVVASAIPGHRPLSIVGSPEFKTLAEWLNLGYTVRYGTAALADLAGGAQMRAEVPGSVTSATDGAWTVALVANPASLSGLSADLILAEVHTPAGTYRRWRLVATKTARTQVVAIDADGAATTVIDHGGVNITMALWDFAVWQSGSNIEVGYGWRSVGGYRAQASVAGSLRGVGRLVINPTGVTNSAAAMPMGHLAVWAGHSLPVVDGRDGAMISALFGYGWSGIGTSAEAPTGEPATRRLARLAAEDGITADVPAVAAAHEMLMGYQQPGSALALYQECEAADGGVLYEDGFGLGYLPRMHRYNPPVTLTLDGAADQVADAPEPVDDDQQLRNRVRVTRPHGSSAVAEDADSIAAVGLYEPPEMSVNLASDGPLPSIAGWQVHVGASTEMRWPLISVDLAGSPELIDQVLACRVQSRIVMDNPPPQALGSAVDVLVEGYTEVIGFRVWQIDFNCSAASPWRVFTVGDPVFGRLDTGGSELALGVDDAATELLVATDVGSQRWITDAERPGNFPFAAHLGGEVVKVTGIDGTYSPQTFTVERGVNGITKPHPAGSRLRIASVAVA
jgi:hypothetical protein